MRKNKSNLKGFVIVGISILALSAAAVGATVSFKSEEKKATIVKQAEITADVRSNVVNFMSSADEYSAEGTLSNGDTFSLTRNKDMCQGVLSGENETETEFFVHSDSVNKQTFLFLKGNKNMWTQTVGKDNAEDIQKILEKKWARVSLEGGSEFATLCNTDSIILKSLDVKDLTFTQNSQEFIGESYYSTIKIDADSFAPLEVKTSSQTYIFSKFVEKVDDSTLTLPKKKDVINL